MALNHYFAKKRGQAVGLSMAGTALGMLIMPQLVRILLEEFGFRGAVLLLSGLALHSAVGSTLLQPAKWHLKDELIDIEMTDSPPVIIIEEDEADGDALPEIKSLLFNNNRKIDRKLSETSMNRLMVRPAFPMTKNSTSVTIPSKMNELPARPTFHRITSTTSMSLAVRKRKESVISRLSNLDFGSGSCLHIHLDVSENSLVYSDMQ